jgi:hypothetical protein
VTPLLAIINFMHARPENVFLFVFNALLVVTVSMIVLIGTIRRHRRHRALASAKADALSAFLAASVAKREAEMQDFRVSRWGMAISLLAIDVNQPITKFGWQPFGIRAAMVLAAMLLLVTVVAGHCQKNLKPELLRRKTKLEQLS